MKNPQSRLLPLLLLSAAAVQAAGTDVPIKNNALEEARDNLREIRNIENNLREEAAWFLQKNRQEDAATPAETAQTPPLTDISGSAQACLKYQNVEIKGINLINAEKIRNNLPKCVTEQSLNQLSRDITAAYIEKGYPYNKIDFIEENGGLTVRVTEGRIKEITGGSRTVNIHTLFPGHKNKPVNIRYLDQGIEQANKLSGNNVSVDVYPHDDGTATIALQNETGKNWFGSITVDNKGSSSRPAVARVQAGIDSPLGLSDSLYISGHSNIRHGNGYYSRGGNLFYNVPYGMWTFSGYVGQSRSQSITRFSSGVELAYRSRNQTAGIKAERVISRGQKHIASAYAGTDYLRTKAVYGGSTIAMQSPRLATVQAGLSHSYMLKNGIWMNNIGLEVGTRMWGAKDHQDSPFTARHRLYTLQSDLSQSRRLGKWLLRNQHRLSAQYSKSDLYATKQFSAGDRNNVRGFKKLSLDGNSGMALNNNLLARRYTKTGIYVEPYVGADWGFAKDTENRYRGTGIAAGINIGYRQRWQFNLESARGFFKDRKQSKAREEQINASFRVYF